MTVQLVLTEEIIDCFHFCAKKADYQQLFNDYPRFFIELVENLEKVKFPDGIWQTIAKNARHLLDILKQWHSDSPCFGKEIVDVEKKEPKFLAHFKDFGSVKDWNDFYNEYKSTADLMIGLARKQGIIDFKIECKGASFGNFVDRDNFLKSYKENKKEPQAAPRRRTRIIDDNSWLTRASTPDIAANGDVLEVAEQKPKVPEHANKKHTSQTMISKEPVAFLSQESIQNSSLDVADANKQEEFPKGQLLKEIDDLKKDGQEILEELEAIAFKPQEQKMECKEERMTNKMDSAQQELTVSVTELTKKLIQLDEKQYELEAKSRILRENDDINRQHLENRVLEQLKAQDEQMKLREEHLERKMEEMMETIKLMAKKSAEENAEACFQKENYDSNLQQLELRIQEQLKTQEEQMKLRENKLRTREQELDEKVNEIRLIEEHLDMKVDEIRLGEENLRRKLGEMMEMMKLVLGNTTAVGPENLDAQGTNPVQDNTIGTCSTDSTNYIEPTVPQSGPADAIVQSPDQATSPDESTSEDDVFQKMEEEFQRELAEQNRVYEEKLSILREQRTEKNKKAEEERRRISGNLTRAAPESQVASITPKQ